MLYWNTHTVCDIHIYSLILRMETKCEKVKVKAESKSSEKKVDFGDKTGRTRRKMIKMRIQPASVFVDEGEDKIEVGKVRILYQLS